MTDKSAGKALKLGAKIRRLRRAGGMTQAQLAAKLGISPSYLNLIEHNNRNVTVDLLLRLAEQFGLNLTDLAEDEEGQLVADLMEVFGDDMFEAMDLTNTDVRDLVSATPTASKAVVALYDAYRKTQMDILTLTEQVSDEAGALLDFESQLPAERVSDFIQEHANHYPDIEAEAERIRQEARLDARDPFNAMVDYAQSALGVRVAVLPPAPGAEAARRYDPTGRTLEISERLARHILIRPDITEEDRARTEERAQEVAAAIRRGASLDSLIEAVHDPVEQSRIGPAVRDSLPVPWRGQLQYASTDDVVGPFPIPSSQQDAFAVVKVDEVVEAGEYTLDDQELRTQIRSFLQREKLMEEVLSELRRSTYIDIRY